MRKEEHLEYFKALVEGHEDVEDWWTWSAAHEPELSSWLSRGQISRLKRAPLYTIYGILSECGFNYPRPDHYVHPKFHQPLVIPIEWLVEEVSIATVDHDLGRHPISACEWNIVKGKIVEGDECWTFRSPAHTWAKRMGRAGFAIVRNGVPVDAIVTMLN